MGIKPGQIWRELDQRIERTVRVVRINGDTVIIQNVETGRKTRAKVSRFNGKAHGYTLLEDMEG